MLKLQNQQSGVDLRDTVVELSHTEPQDIVAPVEIGRTEPQVVVAADPDAVEVIEAPPEIGTEVIELKNGGMITASKNHRLWELRNSWGSWVRALLVTTKYQARYVFGSWLIRLLPFVPAGFALYYTNMPSLAVFIINFIAIIPTSIILGVATDELMLRAGDILGGLIYITFG
jgi:hypothetical protein